ncbi:hypothetical protein Glove_566g28 [Diversispora epigaea]|uniref:Uncharacterized protein n=1 Tax=Diversispora epigaea TaxID=1348612 RepID=A0A397GEM1_9GLOM|nr:hypothetical protein Glove_566g28 [Diversispora epigaea]
MSTQSERDTPTVPAYTEASTVDSQNFQENIDHTLTEAEAPPSRPESPENSENFEPEIEEKGSRATTTREPTSRARVAHRPSPHWKDIDKDKYPVIYQKFKITLTIMSTQSERDTPTVPAYTEASTVDSQNFQENIDHTLTEAEAPPSRPESPENSENFEPEIEEKGSRATTTREPTSRAWLNICIKFGMTIIIPKLTRKETYYALIGAFREVCIEIYPDWDTKTLTIASSWDQKKMSYHISTCGMRLKNITACALFTDLVRKKLPVELQNKKDKIVDNIANKSSFSLRMLGTPKIIKETNEHVRPKRAVMPEDGTIFDFMLRPPNDEVPVIDSSLLIVPEPVSTRIYNSHNKATDITEVELELLESLLKEANIEGYELLPPTDKFPDTFPLKHITSSHYPLCEREYGNKDSHDSENTYVNRNKKSYSFYCHRANQNKEPGARNPSLKLVIDESVSDRENSLPISEELDRSRISNPNDHFVWGNLLRMCTSGKKYTCVGVYKAIQATIACVQQDSPTWILKLKHPEDGLYFKMASRLDLAKFEISIIEHGGESVKLISLINRAVTKELILYDEINFLPYPPNVIPPKTEFFNLFLGFLAKLSKEINPEIMKPILWHVKYVICDGNEELNDYVWNWWAFLVQKPAKKTRSILVLKSTLQ